MRLRCAIGAHPDNPAGEVPSRAWYVRNCSNGDSGWREICPECGRWHRRKDLDIRDGVEDPWDIVFRPAFWVCPSGVLLALMLAAIAYFDAFMWAALCP